ncbi:AMP-binding protein, partial [Streptomyces rimosus]
TDTALHDLVGFFVNTLVLRVDTSGAPGFRTLVARVRETGLEAYAHQDVPVERVVDALRPDRTDDRHPLFQTLLVWQNTPDAAPELTGATTEARELHTGRLVTDLEISVTETPGREPGADTLAGAAHFNADLFDRATVEELLDGLRRLLMDVAADPDRPVGGLDTRAAGERGERETAAADELRTGLADERRAGLAYEPRTDLVDERRAAPAYEPRTVPAADEPRTAPADEPRAEQPAPTAAAPAPLLPELFAAQAARTPGAPALTFQDTTLTYGELDAAANRLARLLIERGAGPERFVALELPRSADLVTAVLAVLKTGAAYVPLEPGRPAARNNKILRDARPVLLLTTRTPTEASPAPCLLWNGPELADALRQCPDTPVRDHERIRPLLPAHPAYVIHT